MKVYSIDQDVSLYQQVIPVIDESKILDFLKFNCEEIPESWLDTEWYIPNPKKAKGHFYYIGTRGAFAFDQRVFESELYASLETCGQILPIKLEDGEQLYVLNVLECVNALNKKDTIFEVFPSGNTGRILKYSFYPERFPESSIFKVPESSKYDILTYTGVDDFVEFYTLYKELGFTGLLFNEVY